eukprot:530510-Rhodomonas_salina.4
MQIANPTKVPSMHSTPMSAHRPYVLRSVVCDGVSGIWGFVGAQCSTSRNVSATRFLRHMTRTAPRRSTAAAYGEVQYAYPGTAASRGWLRSS